MNRNITDQAVLWHTCQCLLLSQQMGVPYELAFLGRVPKLVSHSIKGVL